GDQLPHVNSSTSCGANTIPSTVITLMNTAVSVATLFARRHADSSPSTAIFCENVVMNAVESAPSAKRSRNKFGNRNAIRNASRFLPAPKRPANTISRIRPSTRLDRMATPTTPVARVLIRRSTVSAILRHFVRRFCETPILKSLADLRRIPRLTLAFLRAKIRENPWRLWLVLASELLDGAAASFQQCEKAVGSTDVAGADNHEISLPAAKKAVDFRKPVLVAHINEASA